MLPYVLPFALYLGLTYVVGMEDLKAHYAWLYGATVLLVGAVTTGLLYRRGLLRPHARIIPGIVVGLVGIALWIGIYNLGWDQYLAAHLPTLIQPRPRPGFDPFSVLEQPSAWAFIAIRMVGLAVLVPVAEELFWRGFLARWLLDPDWQKQPLGRFTPVSFAIVTLMFTLAHPEWLAAAVYCALLNLLIAWTRELWNCVVAHGVSNLVLGIYIVATWNWELW